MRTLPIILSVSSVLNPVAAHALDIPVISRDAKGKETVVAVEPEDYFKATQQALSAVNDSLTSVLECKNIGQQWPLTSVVVGIAFQAAVNFGPLLSVSATPRMRAVYTRAKDPIFP